MSSITIGAFASLLTFVTPALPAFLVYRYFYPRSKTLPSSEGILLIVSALFSWGVNGVLISRYVERLLQLIPSDLNSVTSSSLLPLFKFEIDQCDLLDFMERLLGTGHPFGDSFWLFTVQLHVRAVVFSFILLKGSGVFGWLEKEAQLAPYKDKNSCLNFFYVILARMGGGKITSDPEKYERQRIQFQWLNSWRDAFLDPWVRLTLANRKREILMVDILTKSDNLYSGFLTSFIQKEGELTAVSMEYAIRFFPSEKTADKFFRRKELIKSNGELVIPAAEIETIHFWEIRLGTSFEAYVGSKNDGERLKWYIILKHIWPEIIVTIKVLFLLNLKDAMELHDELEAWAAASGLTETFKSVEIGLSEDLEKALEAERKRLDDEMVRLDTKKADLDEREAKLKSQEKKT